jgi:alpha-amylase/alpha-mannosidase (GH57 family)
MERYICIYGHFYQPPRENPWLEYVELQDSASRILDSEGYITQIVKNYSKISFNFGPTLLDWM